MRALVECVPNFSEGRNPETIRLISNAISSVPGVALLNVEPDADYNRVVVTFAGDPLASVEAAFRAHKVAAERIDMTRQTGNHPRMGAADVVPFIPISGITMTECVRLSELYAHRVWEELGIPMYLYEAAARTPERKNLATIRSGEYEGLEEKLRDPHWKPDIGDAVFVPRSGATVTGARFFLIAYNVNIDNPDPKFANEIALNIRSLGRPKVDENGKPILNDKGKKIFVPGRLKDIKAMGVPLERDGRKISQVSINVINYRNTPVHVVYEEVLKDAPEYSLQVSGSEIVGLVPQDALVLAGKHALEKNGGTWEGKSSDELLHAGVEYLGLNDLYPFDVNEKVIEKIVEQKFGGEEALLTDLSVERFTTEVASESPAPGGGSVSAAAAAQGVALLEMVCALTVGKKKYEEVWDEMKQVRCELRPLREELIRSVDRDTQAFNALMAAMKLPKETEADKATRKQAMLDATRYATQVPLHVVRTIAHAVQFAPDIAAKGNKNALSDVGVGAALLRAGARGALLNVLINLPSLPEPEQQIIKHQVETLFDTVDRIASSVVQSVQASL
ncbi:MAG: glutamate formimidoyltransferase [bacterium]|nr:glutamate formimidoyltransferase [bacterium]